MFVSNLGIVGDEDKLKVILPARPPRLSEFRLAMAGRQHLASRIQHLKLSTFGTEL